jgi:hypothetical protein
VRFALSQIGAVQTVGTNDIKLKVLGSQITYGAGGPKVDVRVAASFNGDDWNDLYGGKAIATGDSQTFSNIAGNTPLILRINGRYSWLFNKSFRSDSNDGHVYALRKGDILPKYAPFDNQQSLL